MGLEDLFQKAVTFSSNIDFSTSKTPDTVSVFESTIRYVGGLLSAYQLNNNQPQALVDKAKQLADKLKLGFNGAVGVPFGFVDFSTNQPVKATVGVQVFKPSSDHVTEQSIFPYSPMSLKPGL